MAQSKFKYIAWSLLGSLTALSLAVKAAPVSVTGIEFIGEGIFPTATTFSSTTVGGLSGITYDAAQNRYYSIADDRSAINPARFYTLTIDLSTGSLTTSNITFTNVTTLLNSSGTPFTTNSLDPEGIALFNGDVFISSEGEVSAARVTNPFVNRFLLGGQQSQVLPIPLKFLPIAPVPTTVGIRNNLAFESLTLTPNQQFLYTASENALVQDGPAAAVGIGTRARILRFNLTTSQPDQEFIYNADPVAEVPVPSNQFATNGLVELLALDDEGTFLALERSFSVGAVGSGGTGNIVRLYEISLAGATDVRGIQSLSAVDLNGVVAARKRLLFDFTTLNRPIDNLEALALGPVLPNGKRSLIVVSDNNFSPTQFTQFLAFGIDLKTAPFLGSSVIWSNPFYGNRGTVFADVTGDGQADAVVINDSSLTVRRSTGVNFSGTYEPWTSEPYFGSRGTFIVDVTGDGRADAVAVNDGAIAVRRSNGTSFGSYETWSGAFFGSRGTFFADVDADGDNDAIAVNDGGITVQRSNGNIFGSPEPWSVNPYFGSQGTFFVDVTGDRRADAIVVNAEGVTIRRSNGTTFGPNEFWSGPVTANIGIYFADVTGEGLADLVAVNTASANLTGVSVLTSNGTNFSSSEPQVIRAPISTPFAGNIGSFFADVNGDGKADGVSVNTGGTFVSRFQ